MQNINIRVVFVILVLSFAFLNWLFKQLKEQNEKRKVMARQKALELENLRTGGRFEPGAPASSSAPVQAPVQQSGTGSPSARESLEQIAARRRARMNELRAQQASRGASTGSGVSTAPQPMPQRDDPTARVLGQILGIPTKAPTVPPRTPVTPPTPIQSAPPRPANQGNAGARQRAAQRMAARQQRAASKPPQRPLTQAPMVQPPAAGSPRPPTISSNTVSTPQSSSLAPTMGVRGPQVDRRHYHPGGFSLGGQRLSAQSLRTAFILREVLDKPMALREEGER